MSQLNENILEKLKNLYPSFLDSSENSNFTKHLRIRSNRHVDILRQLRNLEFMQRIERPLQIQKEQKEEYNYKLTFIAKIEDMKSFVVTDADGTVIIEHNFDTKTDSYEETLELTSSTIIPLEKYILTVTDKEGYVYEKGYPENDVVKNDIFDHDTALDIIGKLYNITRYTHIETTNYIDTIPSFHVKTTEDDYYYMKRIQTYIGEYGFKELPLLEFWKFYGFDATLTNRKDLICRQNISYEDEHYMETKKGYNSCAYDFTVNYYDFPSNLKKPTSIDLENLFQNSMPLQKKVFLNFDLKELLEEFSLSDGFKYKIGETVVESDDDFYILNVQCEKVYLEDLILNIEDGLNYNFIFIDDKGYLLNMLDFREDKEKYVGVLGAENNDIIIKREGLKNDGKFEN